MKINVTEGKMIIEDELINERTTLRNLLIRLESDILNHELVMQKSEKKNTNEKLELQIKECYPEDKYKTNMNLVSTSKDMYNFTNRQILNETPLKNPNRFNTGSVKITMGTIDKPDIDQIADIDKDISGYDRIRVFDSMDRKCNITIINDGSDKEVEKDSDSLYFIVNRNGIDHEEEAWSQNEIMLYPGEAWKIYDVYELRIRSETQGCRYRITEDDIIVGSTIRSVL